MISKSRFFFSLAVLLPLSTFGARAADPAPAFHFVVTGGLMGVADGSRSFFNSPIFRLKSTSKTGERFVITDAKARAFRFRNTILLPKSAMAGADLSKAKPGSLSGVVKGFMGAQLFAIGSGKGSMIPVDLSAEGITRELGAIAVPINWEIRTYNGVEILAVTSSLSNGRIEWPTGSTGLDEVLAVRGRFGSEVGSEYLFFPRQVASTDRVFGTIDSILKSDSNAQYIDLGDALFGPDVEDIDMAKRLQTLILRRKPAVLGAAWQDFRAFWLDSSLMNSGPYIASLSGKEIIPSARRVENQRGVPLLFAALPTNSPLLEMVLPAGTGVLPLDEALEAVSVTARKSMNSYVIGLSQDTMAASKAVESPVFDAVLSLVSAKGGALPSYDEIDLSQNRRDGLRSVAPLVRVSSIDVTEVSGFVDESGGLVKLVIKRHAIVDDGVVAEDAARVLETYEQKSDILASGLPSRSSVSFRGTVYSENELNAILGGLLKNARSDTELAIIEKLDAVTPIESEIPLRLAESLLNDRGRAVWLSIRGKYLKRMFKAMKERQFGIAVSVVGGTIKGPTIGQREISDAENYRIVVSEKVFFAIDRFMSRESLFAMRNLPSSSLQTALLEGGKDTLKILSEIRKRDSRDDPNIGESRALFAASFPIADLLDPGLTKGLSSEDVTTLIKDADGRVRRTLILDISDLDLGLKFNAANQTLETWQEEAKVPGANNGFTEPRFWDPTYSHKLFYAKGSLKYIGTIVDTEVLANIKYFQPNPDLDAPTVKDINRIRPAKDSVKFEGELRVPFRRLFDEPPTGFWDLGAIARLTHETQIWPNSWLTNLPPELWPTRTNDLRLLLGLSAKPLASDETLRFGGVLDYDISRTSPLQSFAYGLELGGQGKWNIGFIALKLESNLRQLFPITAPEKSRMGLVWLIDGKIEVPIYGAFSLSLLTNTTLGTRMTEPLTPGYSVLFGFALSYSDRLKWLL